MLLSWRHMPVVVRNAGVLLLLICACGLCCGSVVLRTWVLLVLRFGCACFVLVASTFARTRTVLSYSFFWTLVGWVCQGLVRFGMLHLHTFMYFLVPGFVLRGLQ